MRHFTVVQGPEDRHKDVCVGPPDLKRQYLVSSPALRPELFHFCPPGLLARSGSSVAANSNNAIRYGLA